MKHYVISLESGKRYSWENRTGNGEGVYLCADGGHCVFLLDSGDQASVNKWSLFSEEDTLTTPTGCPEIDSATTIYRDETIILTMSGETVKAYKLFQSPTTKLYNWLYRGTWEKRCDHWVKRGVLHDGLITVSDYDGIISATR